MKFKAGDLAVFQLETAMNLTNGKAYEVKSITPAPNPLETCLEIRDDVGVRRILYAHKFKKELKKSRNLPNWF